MKLVFKVFTVIHLRHNKLRHYWTQIKSNIENLQKYSRKGDSIKIGTASMTAVNT